MEWLIEHVDDPSVDAPLPGHDSSGAVGATAAATPGPSASGPNLLRSLSSQSSTDESCRQDELTEIFKRIRRKREFRPDSRVRGFIQLECSLSFLLLAFRNLIVELTPARSWAGLHIYYSWHLSVLDYCTNFQNSDMPFHSYSFHDSALFRNMPFMVFIPQIPQTRPLPQTTILIIS